MIFLDNAATTLIKPPEVAEAVQEALQICASPGRGGYRAAEQAAQVVFHTRELAAELFRCDVEQVSFTLNATHGLNIAIRSLVGPGSKVVVSGFEHNAVMRPLYALGAKITVAGRKLFDAEDTLRSFDEALRAGADCAVCTHVSNVFGYVLPIEQIAELCARYEVPLIVDASQSAGSRDVTVPTAFTAMPGHKGLYGPQGTGILISRGATKPLLYGGTGSLSKSYEMPDFLPDRLEAGTQSVVGIAGLGAGLEYVLEQTPEGIGLREEHLAHRMARALEKIPGVHCFASEHDQSGVVSVTVCGWDCEDFAARLAAHDIAVRAGLHCAPLAHESAGTLENGTVRASVGAMTMVQEVESFVQIVKLLAKSGVGTGK